MSARRGASGLSGILAVDKAAGLTSHDVVARVRRATGERRVGHAGTLDPAATGLLVVLVGPATRLAPYLSAEKKTYLARVAFGAETETDDAEGAVVREAPVPREVGDAGAARAVAARFTGVREQVPPSFSAIKRGGVVAHRAARAGEALVLEPRAIEIFDLEVLSVDAAAAVWDIALTVSKGTYVRAIARDLGRELGSAAHLASLRRTRSGALELAGAMTLDEIEAAEEPCAIAARFTDPAAALGLPVVEVEEAGALRVASGSPLSVGVHCAATGCPAAGPVAIVREGVVLAVYVAAGATLRAQTVIPGGVRGGAV